MSLLRPPRLAAGMLCVLATAAPLGRAPASPGSAGGLDDFLCRTSVPVRGGPAFVAPGSVPVADAFQTTIVEVKKPLHRCSARALTRPPPASSPRRSA